MKLSVTIVRANDQLGSKHKMIETIEITEEPALPKRPTQRYQCGICHKWVTFQNPTHDDIEWERATHTVDPEEVSHMLPIERRADLLSHDSERLVVNSTWFSNDTPLELATALEIIRIRNSRRVRLWLGDGVSRRTNGEVLKGWMRRAYKYRIPPVGNSPRYPVIVKTLRSKHGQHFEGNDVVLAEVAGPIGWELLWKHPLHTPYFQES